MRASSFRAGVLCTLGFVIPGAQACQSDNHATPFSSTSTPSVDAKAQAVAGLTALLKSIPTARVVSRDALGVPRFFLGQSVAAQLVPVSMNGEQAARVQLQKHARLLGMNATSLRDTELRGSHRLPGGAELLQFGQRARGLEVFGARANVLLDVNKNLVSLSNNLTPAANATAKQKSFVLTADQAVAQAYTLKSKLPSVAVSKTSAHGEWQDFALTTAPHAPRVLEASAKQVLFPSGNTLVPAYQVELLTRAGDGDETNQAYGYLLAADNGRVLWSASLTASDSFNYRVWADSQGVPADGPLKDVTPHPSGKPDKVAPGFATPTLVTIEGFNRNADGRPDPWLAPTDTYTFGNNVHAYSDRDQYSDDAGVPHHDGFNEGSDLRADLTSANTFDRVYDVTRAPDYDDDQIKAAITQLFYTTNWLHDYWYDSGFDEISKNAQQLNYGRGGSEGDPLRAEAQDSANDGTANNANMSTFSDGRSPRMQMYVWSGLPNRALATSPAITFDDPFGAASYGPQTFDLAGQFPVLGLSDDGSTELPEGVTAGTGTVTDGCQPITNVTGLLAVIDRGVCPFLTKVQNAQKGGAIAVLLLNNAPGHTSVNPAASDSSIKIPVLALSFEDGQKVKAALAAGPVIATTFNRKIETQRDGTIDNSVVAHEWGHYIHHRLVLCGSTSCGGMSEGWGDFNALMLAIRAGDTFEGKAYPLAQYATGGLDPNSAYFGIRRAPYSTDMTKNPFTFQHIRQMAVLPTTAPLAAASADPSEVHNVGEIWAETLFEAYVNLIEAGNKAGRPFAESKRRMADYVVVGMKTAPVEPSFVEQRDAILAGVYAMAKADATRMDDFTALAQGFAKRGLGVGTVAPPTASETLDEAVESFAYKGDLGVDELSLDDSVQSCDGDGRLDVGESGKLSLRVSNNGWLPLTQSKVQITSSDPRVTFDAGGLVTVTPLDPYGDLKLTIGVKVEAGARPRSLLKLSLTASDPDSFKPTADLPFELLYNFDDALGAASVDEVESDKTAWVTAPNTLPIWSREGDATNHVWHGDDIGTSSDESLESPDLVVSADNPFIITFSHRYSFETGPATATGPDVAFDGSVLEISQDGGATWEDISKYGEPSYVAKLYSTAPLPDAGPSDEPIEPDSNALAGRPAWAGESPGYPAYTTEAIDLGSQFAGKTVRIRFRIGTDEGTGAPGWDIDHIAFGTSTFDGISNKPFAAITDDRGVCVSQ